MNIINQVDQTKDIVQKSPRCFYLYNTQNNRWCRSRSEEEYFFVGGWRKIDTLILSLREKKIDN